MLSRTARRRVKKFIFWSEIMLIIALGAGVGVVAGAYYQISKVLPAERLLSDYKPLEGTKIYSSDGVLLAKLTAENREAVPLKKIPKQMKDAIVAIEDSRFYEHRGLDWRGVGRAMWMNVRGGDMTGQGASTITQQLARNVYLSASKTFSRKMKETLLAVQIERNWTKEQILETYLNQVYFGSQAYGIQTASKVYFGKTVDRLSLAEAATLAGLPQRPSELSPYETREKYGDTERTLHRRNLVLQRMLELGYIKPEQFEKAKKAPIKLAHKRAPKLSGFMRAHYFADEVRKELERMYGGEEVLQKSSLRVVTSLNYQMQVAADKAARRGLARNRGPHRISEMALACINPQNGHVMAMVGGCNDPWEKYQFNCATQAKRQPGSSFKAFVYATALAQGWSPYKYVAGTIPRVKLGNGQPWVVRNHGGANGGSMVSVFAQSVNTAAVHTIWQVGPENVIATAKELGIQSALQPNYSLALGTSEVTVQEMASAYGAFATMGKHAKPVYILEVRDANGNIIHQAKPDVRDVKLPQHVFSGMERLTRAVVQGGTGSAAGRVAGAHGKTGTSESYRDAWFVGYTPELTCAVWAGNRDNSAMRRSYGGGICAPVWADFMSEGTKIFRTAKNKFAPKDKQQPQLQNANFKAIEAGRYWEVGPERLTADASGMMRVRVCSETGERGRGACPKVELREYKSGSEPKSWCSEHRRRERVSSADGEERPTRRRRSSRRRRSEDGGSRSPGGAVPDVPAPDATPAVSPE